MRSMESLMESKWDKTPSHSFVKGKLAPYDYLEVGFLYFFSIGFNCVLFVPIVRFILLQNYLSAAWFFIYWLSDQIYEFVVIYFYKNNRIKDTNTIFSLDLNYCKLSFYYTVEGLALQSILLFFTHFKNLDLIKYELLCATFKPCLISGYMRLQPLTSELDQNEKDLKPFLKVIFIILILELVATGIIIFINLASGLDVYIIFYIFITGFKLSAFTVNTELDLFLNLCFVASTLIICITNNLTLVNANVITIYIFAYFELLKYLLVKCQSANFL